MEIINSIHYKIYCKLLTTMPDYNEYKVGMYLQSYKYLKRSLVKKYYIKLCQYMLDLTEKYV